MKQIREDLGLKTTWYNHVNDMIRLGYVEDTEDGYRATGSNAPKPKKTVDNSKKNEASRAKKVVTSSGKKMVFKKKHKV